jgi:4-diphosphocytidyl-2-C-methyl-D-erythritol kinase
VIERAPAKINVCLFLGPERPDGRHDLVTVFQPVDIKDSVTLAHADRDEVVCPGVEGENLAAAALAAFKSETRFDEPVRISIRKRIPVAGGMAGGSADAAATLRLLARRSGIKADLHAIADRLGADVPAQIEPARYLATGSGEVLERLQPAAPYGVLVLEGPEPLATGDVFRQAAEMGLRRSPEDLAERLAEVRAALPDLPAELAVNDLEPAALALMPEIAERMGQARAAGADHVLLSGSGPTVLGLFRDPGMRTEPPLVATL